MKVKHIQKKSLTHLSMGSKILTTLLIVFLVFITYSFFGDNSNNRREVFARSSDPAPTITNISSDKANGTYTVDEVIDIDVTFSEAVTSTGNVTVTLETGDTDQTCTFTITGATTGTCNYTVQSGDETSDLTVSSISGTIEDAASNALVNFVPATNLDANKDIVVDTTSSVLSAGLPSTQQTSGTTEVTLSLTTDENAICKYDTTASTTYASMANSFDITGTNSHSTVVTELTDGNSYTYFVRCIDGTGNIDTNDYEISFSVDVAVIKKRSGSSRRLVKKFTSTESHEVTSFINKGHQEQFANTLDSNTDDVSSNILSTSIFSFTKKLEFGMTDVDVLILQKKLNSLGFILAPAGAGSAGNETTYFGPRTLGAVHAYQKSKGLHAVGVVGPLTRGLLNLDK